MTILFCHYSMKNQPLLQATHFNIQAKWLFLSPYLIMIRFPGRMYSDILNEIFKSFQITRTTEENWRQFFGEGPHIGNFSFSSSFMCPARYTSRSLHGAHSPPVGVRVPAAGISPCFALPANRPDFSSRGTAPSGMRRASSPKAAQTRAVRRGTGQQDCPEQREQQEGQE